MYKIEKSKLFDTIYIEQENIHATLLSYGATIKQIQTPNIDGEYEDILMAYNFDEDYIDNDIYLNGTIGPIAGRIKNGEININQRHFQFNKNQAGKHTLHSGDLALTYQNFKYKIEDNDQLTIVKMMCQTQSKDLNYAINVTYTIQHGQCQIEYDAYANHDFAFSLTNHAYFNLSGNLKTNIKNHIIQIETPSRHQLDEDQVPTHKILIEPLYDFTKPTSLIKRMKALKSHPFEGYDDIYIFENKNDIRYRSSAYDPTSHRELKVYSDYDHMVFYTHNNTSDTPLKHLNAHPQHYGLCFECQKAPYGFNDDAYVKKNTHDKYTIIYQFSVRK
jgi:aldose 1-epimerase